jgi:Leucine-rich repeat (LRR) protein
LKGIETLKKLSILDLKHNEIDELPEVLLKLNSLEVLYIRDNPLKDIQHSKDIIKKLKVRGLKVIDVDDRNLYKDIFGMVR